MSKLLKSQKYLLKILSIFGFFAFNCQTFEKTYRRWIYCYLFNLATNLEFVYVTFYYILTYNDFLHDGSRVTRVVHTVELVTNLIITFIIVTATLFRNDELIKFLKALEMIESQVERLNIYSHTKFYERLKLGTNVVIIISLIFHIIMQLIYVNLLMANESLIHKLTSLCYLFFSFYFFIVSLFVFVQLKTLEKFSKTIKENLSYCFMHSSFYEREIDIIYKIFFDIQDLMESWNYCNGFLVFGGYVYIFGVLSSELYFVCVSAVFTDLVRTNFVYYIYNACNLMYCIPMLLIIALIGKTCTQICLELENCVAILRNSYNDPQRIKGKMEKFLMHLDDLSFYKKFTANDFFIIDDSMIFKVKF